MSRQFCEADSSVDEALRLNQCTKRFRSSAGDDVMALDSVSLVVPRGQVVSLIGSNGAGKSSLVSAIAGTMPLDEGSILVNSDDLTEQPSWRRARLISLVRQNPADNVCYPMTVEQNFALALGVSRRALDLWRPRRAVDGLVRDRAASMLARFGMGLENRLKTPVNLLSGGQRQAVAVAMAMVREPEVLLADEHTAALDPKSAAAVLEISEAFVREARITMVLITHDMGVALRYADRVVLMHKGRVVVDLGASEKAGLNEEDMIGIFRETTGENAPDITLLRH